VGGGGGETRAHPQKTHAKGTQKKLKHKRVKIRNESTPKKKRRHGGGQLSETEPKSETRRGEWQGRRAGISKETSEVLLQEKRQFRVVVRRGNERRV